MIDKAAKRIEFTLDLDLKVVFRASFVEPVLDVLTKAAWHQMQRLLVHGAPGNLLDIVGLVFVDPSQRVDGTFVGRRILLQPLL